MARILPAALATLVASLALTGTAHARGGDYVLDGGTAAQQRTVHRALHASAFDWSLVPAQVTVHVARNVVSHATRGHIYLDADLLNAGVFSWATVQDEYAHQVDFFLFDEATRARLNAALGGQDWCRATPGLEHGAYGCERFASTLVWSYWPSPANAYRPASAKDESAAMPPARFRALMAELIGAPRSVEPLAR